MSPLDRIPPDALAALQTYVARSRGLLSRAARSAIAAHLAARIARAHERRARASCDYDRAVARALRRST